MPSLFPQTLYQVVCSTETTDYSSLMTLALTLPISNSNARTTSPGMRFSQCGTKDSTTTQSRFSHFAIKSSRSQKYKPVSRSSTSTGGMDLWLYVRRRSMQGITAGGSRWVLRTVRSKRRPVEMILEKMTSLRSWWRAISSAVGGRLTRGACTGLD